MGDGFKVQVNLKADQHLLNVRADSVEELVGYLTDLFGENDIIGLFAPKGGVVPVDVTATSTAVGNVQQAFPGTQEFPGAEIVVAQGSVPATPADTAYDPCPNPGCGELKTKWVPPGVSKKTGRAYQGFYACPTNHR